MPDLSSLPDINPKDLARMVAQMTAQIVTVQHYYWTLATLPCPSTDVQKRLVKRARLAHNALTILRYDPAKKSTYKGNFDDLTRYYVADFYLNYFENDAATEDAPNMFIQHPSLAGEPNPTFGFKYVSSDEYYNLKLLLDEINQKQLDIRDRVIVSYVVICAEIYRNTFAFDQIVEAAFGVDKDGKEVSAVQRLKSAGLVALQYSMVLVLGAMVGRLRRMALMKVADAAAPPDMSSLIRESFERQPFVRDAANPEQFILDNYGRFGGRAGAFAKAYRLTKARLGDQVNGIAGSTAAGRARMQSWPSGLSYREVYCLDHFNNQFELITEAQAARCGPEMARMWRLRPTLPDELPSDLDIPVWIVGADREYGLDNLAEEIFNETGVLVQYPIAREGE